MIIMVKQISLDTWQIQHLTDLLAKASDIVAKKNKPIILYRQTIEDEDGACEEIVCSLTQGYVIVQQITSGGMVEPSFQNQSVFTIEKYPQELSRESKDRFSEMVNLLEEIIKSTS